jgi:integrase
MSEWKKTNHTGIRYREHESRKIGRVQKDKYFTVRFQVRGKVTETGIGWMSEGVTINDAIEKLKLFRTNAKLANGAPTKMKELFSENATRTFQRITIRDFIEGHYIPYSKGVKSAGQHQKECQHCTHWIIPTIGDKRLGDLQDSNGNSGLSLILVLKQAMEQAEKSNRMTQHVLFTLSQIFRLGQKSGIIQPAAKFPGNELKLKINNSRQRFLTRDEAAKLISLIRERDETLADMAEFSLLTGCRRGELFGMTWQDVSLESASILLRDTKNKSDRNLYLTQRAVEIIRNQPSGQPQDVIFKDKAGKPYSHLPHNWTTAVRDSKLNDGITDPRLKICWHSLRHTAASWLAIGGVDLFKIAKILGHRNLKSTQIYSHLSEQSIRDAMQQVMG